MVIVLNRTTYQHKQCKSRDRSTFDHSRFGRTHCTAVSKPASSPCRILIRPLRQRPQSHYNSDSGDGTGLGNSCEEGKTSDNSKSGSSHASDTAFECSCGGIANWISLLKTYCFAFQNTCLMHVHALCYLMHLILFTLSIACPCNRLIRSQINDWLRKTKNKGPTTDVQISI